jgi:GNAT superfamily N-acetyltransferase
MDYIISITIPRDLSQAEMDRCVNIVCNGGAVDRDKASKNIPRSCVLAVARNGKTIVGVGAIKPMMRRHTADVAKLSGYPLDLATPEVGYISVHPSHRRKGLARRILDDLIRQHPGVLFATTDDTAMKKILKAAKFGGKGQEWDGSRGKLSLWVKTYTP